MVEEVGGPQGYDLPSLWAALHLEAHLGAAALGSGQDVAGSGVHIDVGDGKATIFAGCHLQELIAKLDAVIAAKKSHHLVVKLGVILHVLLIEDVEDAVEVVGLDATLEIGEHIANHLVGEVDGLGGGRRGLIGGRGVRRFVLGGCQNIQESRSPVGQSPRGVTTMKELCGTAEAVPFQGVLKRA